jgi:hypothetical protein
MQTFNKQDRFGFYQAGDYRSYSKVETIYEGARSGKDVTWNFNNNVFGAIDWTQDPATDLAELYRQHAQLLRERYDYLVLWYSGGADSDNILNTFVSNNIRLDEVVSYVNYDATGNKCDFLNGEIFNVAAPKIQKVKDTCQPWITHRLVDLAQFTVDIFSETNTKFDWFYHMNYHFNPNNFSKRNLKQKIPEWMSRIDRGERVGFIHGIDKPSMTGINGNFYFKFSDLVDTAVSAETQNANREWEHDELFYWSPDAPFIPVKQAHVIKRFLQHADSTTPGVRASTNFKFEQIITTIQGKLFYLESAALHRLIYPGWQPVPYQIKTPSRFFTPRDEWFFSLPDNDPAKYSWRVGLEQLWRSVPEKYRLYQQDSTSMCGIKQFTSPLYYLGK